MCGEGLSRNAPGSAIGSLKQPPDFGGRLPQALLLPLPGEAPVRAETITLAPITSARSPPGRRSPRGQSFCWSRILPTLLRLSAPNVLNLLAIAGMITFRRTLPRPPRRGRTRRRVARFPFVMLMQHTAASGMGGGVSSAIAPALGAGKRDTADALVFHMFVLALGLAAVFSGGNAEIPDIGR